MEYKAYEQIKALQGMDELKAFAKKIIFAKANLTQKKLVTNKDNTDETGTLRFSVPNVILAAEPGCGTSTHIRLLTDLLCETQLFSFEGEEKSFEWALSRNDDSFALFLRRIQAAAGFYGQFKGVIGLDLSEVLDQQWPDAAKRLMEYVDAQQGNILFIFVVPFNTDNDLIKRLQAGLASRTPVEVLRTPFPDAEEACSYVIKELEKRQIRCVEETAKARLKKTVQSMRTSSAFDGYQSLQNLIDELSWRIMSKENSDFTIRSADLDFAKDYLDLFCQKYHERKRIIGFYADRGNA